MSRPISNGLFEVAGEKAPKERGFACMQLVKFITDEITNGGDSSWEYRGKEIFVEHALHLMETRGFIEPEDFVL